MARNGQKWPEMAQNAPWGFTNSKISWGRPPRPPQWEGPPPSHTYHDLPLRAKMEALPLSLVPAIDTFVPATSNLKKNPVNWGGLKNILEV